MTRLDTLTFDLDDTLWDNGPVMEHAEQGHYHWLDSALSTWLEARLTALGRYAERFPLPTYVQHRGEVARRFPLRRGDFTWIRRRSLYELLEAYGLASQEAEMWATAAMERFLELRHRLDPYPEVDGLLEALAGEYRLATITNGNVDLNRLPLVRHFPVSIIAGELLAPKPDARPFLAALARLDSAPSRALHVGDSWKEDVLPARRLGMRVAWIDRHGQAADEALPEGVHRLTHVRELPALLARLRAQA
ncbi:HAD family hydrolase [Halomonas salifodinae]|uniref:HAD family hydrolase n=1 Tax=Halomonas salifodinae TaxID=438745 RepID=UPI0033B634E4